MYQWYSSILVSEQINLCCRDAVLHRMYQNFSYYWWTFSLACWFQSPSLPSTLHSQSDLPETKQNKLLPWLNLSTGSLCTYNKTWTLLKLQDGASPSNIILSLSPCALNTKVSAPSPLKSLPAFLLITQILAQMQVLWKATPESLSKTSVPFPCLISISLTWLLPSRHLSEAGNILENLQLFIIGYLPSPPNCRLHKSRNLACLVQKWILSDYNWAGHITGSK